MIIFATLVQLSQMKLENIYCLNICKVKRVPLEALKLLPKLAFIKFNKICFPDAA